MPNNYLLLNIAFMAIAACLTFVCRVRLEVRYVIVLLVVMLGLTAVFDPLLIHFDIVRYHADQISGYKWFGAPVEDTCYAAIAALLLPALWTRFRKGKQ